MQNTLNPNQLGHEILTGIMTVVEALLLYIAKSTMNKFSVKTLQL